MLWTLVGKAQQAVQPHPLLVAANAPVLVAGRAARTPHGLVSLARLGETPQGPVIDITDRMNFPTNHHLNQEPWSSVVTGADLVANLENDRLLSVVADVADVTYCDTTNRVENGSKVIDINAELASGFWTETKNATTRRHLDRARCGGIVSPGVV